MTKFFALEKSGWSTFERDCSNTREKYIVTNVCLYYFIVLICRYLLGPNMFQRLTLSLHAGSKEKKNSVKKKINPIQKFAECNPKQNLLVWAMMSMARFEGQFVVFVVVFSKVLTMQLLHCLFGLPLHHVGNLAKRF